MTKGILKINIPAITGTLDRTIARVVRSASFGLHAAEQLAIVPDDLPDATYQLRVDDGLEPSVEEMRAAFAQWILTCGLRDVVETIGTTLGEARKLLTLFSMAQPDGSLTYGEYIEAGERFASFDRLGLPDKLSCLDELFGEDFLPAARDADQVLSINAARNCLVHRGGVVSERDCNMEGSLEVRWAQWDAIIIQPDGTEVIAEKDTIGEAGSRIGVRRSQTSKLFQIGDTVKFSEQEFVNLCVTLLHFGRSLVEGVERDGQRRGLLEKRAEEMMITEELRVEMEE